MNIPGHIDSFNSLLLIEMQKFKRIVCLALWIPLTIYSWRWYQGIKEEATLQTEEKEEYKVLANYANRVPFIIVDNIYTKNTALVQGDSISLISQTLLYLMGDKERKTMVILTGNKKKMHPVQAVILAVGLACLLIIIFYIISMVVGGR